MIAGTLKTTGIVITNKHGITQYGMSQSYSNKCFYNKITRMNLCMNYHVLNTLVCVDNPDERMISIFQKNNPYL